MELDKFAVNDLTREINDLIGRVPKGTDPVEWGDGAVDARVRALIVTNLQQAALWSLYLIVKK